MFIKILENNAIYFINLSLVTNVRVTRTESRSTVLIYFAKDNAILFNVSHADAKDLEESILLYKGE